VWEAGCGEKESLVVGTGIKEEKGERDEVRRRRNEGGQEMKEGYLVEPTQEQHKLS
jgi:hypothetical protein